MKHLFTLVVIALVNVVSIQAQVKMTRESHGFVAEDAHLCLDVKYKDAGESGINRIWDFRDLTPVSDEISKSPVESIGEGECNMSISKEDGVSFFYNVTDEQLEYRGYRRGDLTIYFSNPIVKMKYPQVYGTSFEGTYEGAITRNGEFGGNVSGTYSTKVDGSGTILLPGNVNLPVIRVKTTKTTKEWGANATATELVKYLWYAQDIRFPVFVSMETATYSPTTGIRVITGESSFLNKNLNPAKQSNNVSKVAAGVDALGSGVSCKISPNPFKDNLQISYTLSKESTMSIDLYNMQGAKLATILPKQLQQGSQVLNYNVGQLTSASGVYFITITIDGKVYNEKIIKQ